jgi:3-phenylpropionate/trans-cinnamate dioxygenase ferredoxin component
MNVHRIGSADDFAPSTASKVIVTDDKSIEHVISVVRIADDFYAIGDRCSHADVSLSDGTVWEDDCEIECPKHGSTFSLRSGAPQSFPATRPVPVYGVERRGDDVVILFESDNPS